MSHFIDFWGCIGKWVFARTTLWQWHGPSLLRICITNQDAADIIELPGAQHAVFQLLIEITRFDSLILTKSAKFQQTHSFSLVRTQAY